MGFFRKIKEMLGQKETERKTQTSNIEEPMKNNNTRDPLDEMDPTQDAVAIWEMMKASEEEKSSFESMLFKQKAYKKLITSRDSYTRQLLGDNIFSYLDNDTKNILLAEISQAYVSQVENESIESLELAKMVAKQGKILDYDTFSLLKNLLAEKKIKRNEFFNPKWINNPKIWEQNDYNNRAYLIKLKIFLDTAPIHTYVNKNGQTLYDVVGECNGISLWESLINMYDTISKLKAFMSGFSDD